MRYCELLLSVRLRPYPRQEDENEGEKPEPCPCRIWIPVRTASANRDRRIRHKSPCRGARIGRDSPLFFSLLFSPLLSPLLFSPLLIASSLLLFFERQRHRFLSFHRHGQANQNIFQRFVSRSVSRITLGLCF